MFAARLPEVNVEELKQRLYDEFNIEIFIDRWNGQPYIRGSFQAYNNSKDADALVKALSSLLPQV